ncbi:hypothetical protein [Actinokineospora sp.]|uniref:hypothetical protein n=1 Tax=Actinokineospora sp. TaxID=1872133 RepID=UPI0040383B6C
MTGGEQWRDELTLIGKLSTLNQDIGLYVVRTLDVDAGRVEPLSAAAECSLGRRLIQLGEALQERAQQRLAVTGEVDDPPA